LNFFVKTVYCINKLFFRILDSHTRKNARVFSTHEYGCVCIENHRTMMRVNFMIFTFYSIVVECVLFFFFEERMNFVVICMQGVVNVVVLLLLSVKEIISSQLLRCKSEMKL